MCCVVRLSQPGSHGTHTHTNWIDTSNNINKNNKTREREPLLPATGFPRECKTRKRNDGRLLIETFVPATPLRTCRKSGKQLVLGFD